MDLLCVILICVGTSISMATPDHKSQATEESLSSSSVIQQFVERVDIFERQLSKQAFEIQSLKAEMSQQQANEIQSLKAEISQQQAIEIQSLKAEMSQQQAIEIQSLIADMSQQQAIEIQSLKVEMSQQQAKEIQSLKAEMSKQRGNMIKLRSKLYTKDQLIHTLLNEVTELTKGEDLPNIEMDKDASFEITKIHEGAQQRQGIRDSVKRIIPVENVPVAFSARLRYQETILSFDSNILFDEVITNVGNAYNSSSGVFTAPVSGIYVFSMSLSIYNNTSSGFCSTKSIFLLKYKI